MSFIGWLTGRDDNAPAPSTPVVAESFSVRILRELDSLKAVAKKSSAIVSPTVYSHLRNIDDVLRPLLKFIESHPVLVETEFLIERIVTDYALSPLKTFAALPASQQEDNGNADLLLIQQYATIEENTRELAEQVQSRGLAELSAQASFIQTKFEQGV